MGLASGKTVAMVSRELGISEQTYYRWRQEFGAKKARSSSACKDAGEGERTAKSSGGPPDGGQAVSWRTRPRETSSMPAGRRRRCEMRVRQRLVASERHVWPGLGQPRSTQRRVKKLPGDAEALRTDVIRLNELVRQLLVSPDSLELLRLEGWEVNHKRRGSYLDAAGAESAQTAAETVRRFLAQRWCAASAATVHLHTHHVLVQGLRIARGRKTCGALKVADRASTGPRGSRLSRRSVGRKTRDHDVRAVHKELFARGTVRPCI